MNLLDQTALVLRIKQELEITHTTLHDQLIMDMMEDAANSIEAAEKMIIKDECLEVECGVAKLPEHTDELIAVRPLNSEGEYGCDCGSTLNQYANGGGQRNPCSGLCNQYYVKIPAFLQAFQSNGCGCSSFGQYFGLTGNAITFGSSFRPSGVRAWVKATNVDCDGFVVMYEPWKRAIIGYCCARMAVVLKSGGYNAGQKKFWWQEWVKQKRKIKGKSNRIAWKQDINFITPVVNYILSV